MGRHVKQLINYTTSDVKAFIDNEDKYKVGIKLYAILQLTKGKPSRELEELYGTSFKQILNWAARFDSQGIEGLRDKPRSGRPARITSEQLEALRLVLLDSPEKQGYNSGTWSGPLVQDFIKNQLGVEYKLANIYNLLHSIGFSYQRAKGVYPERDENKRAQVKADIKKV
ncbi:helix-turn-helix domain-containing protein [Dysgonomonas sp. ZJ709]|uniref:helix-turn-helix domain-containing protein n=1 Tax=Dysgonomonas sp. ZJ709 TaxID=2709797 RepID=UPI0013EC0B2F|nr:helix-turn-helix domain-containing protein [Dysgonomonas sp. ZJ709]